MEKAEKKNIKKTEKSDFLKTVSKIKRVISTPLVKYSVLGIIIVLIAFVSQYYLNRPNFGTYLTSDMDLSSNVYVLGVDEKSEQYKITKVLPNGTTKFQVGLEKSTDDYLCTYSNLESDSKGNIYIVRRKKNLNSVVSDKSMYPILDETVLMFDNNGNYIKQIAYMDFSKDTNPPIEPYIRKIQLVDQNLTLIACRDTHYDIITTNTLLDESPKKIKSFDVVPNGVTTSQDYQWVGDMSVLSTGRVFYSTLNGELYATNNQGQFENCSTLMPMNPFQITGMSVDSSDNLYFTDVVSGKFYKLNTQSSALQNVYNLDSKLSDSKDIKMQDVRTIKLIDSGDYYAPSKAFDRPYHIRFGAQSHLVENLRGAIYPWGLLIMIGIILALAAIFYVIGYLFRIEIKRVTLSTRILSAFLPFFTIAMGILVWVNTSDAVKEYMTVLRNEQARGALTAADNLSGSDFSRINHVSDYMSANYIKLKNSLQSGYSELALKVGDKSDYLVTYIESYGKLYKTLSTKYDVSSASYDRLKFTTPDMVSQNYALIDCILEKYEVDALYDVWNKFSTKNGTDQDSLHVMFKDVYGDMSVTFVPIKDTNGHVVGLVGNVLDDSIHDGRAFKRILTHSAALILVITLLVGLFAYIVVKWALRPLKKIEKAIENMSKGQWDARVAVNTKDELADITETFNIMSEKIGRYTSNLIRLNKEYIRYVPKEMFKLIDKERITQVKLYDNKLVNISIMYVSFNISHKEFSNLNNEDKLFDEINKVHNVIFEIVASNNGIVQSFNGLEMVVLFPENAVDALKASIQLKESDISEIVKKRMNITLGTDEILIGVSGNEDRRGIVLMSDEIMQLYKIDGRLELLGINHIATKNIMNCIDDKNTFNFRYIGRVDSTGDIGYTDIYQVIDGSSEYRKDLYLSTKDLFENGVRLYLSGKFVEARNVFIDVLRVNENDKVSIKYLMMCDEAINKIDKDSGFYDKFKGYII